MRRASTGTLILLFLTVITSYAVAAPTVVISNSGTINRLYFDNVVIIAMENQLYSGVIGSSAAPYINSLLPQSAAIPKDHGGFPGSSESDYVALWSGDTYGSSNGVRNINAPTIIDLLEPKGLTWRAYRESGTGQRLDHWPPGLFTTITGNPARAARAVSASPNAPELVAELNSPNASNFIWFTPTDLHNMHDNSVSSGDTYLQGLVGQILISTTFKTKRCLLMLWWDEYDPAPDLFTGSTVKGGLVSVNSYDHYSVLKLLEVGWNLGNLGKNDLTAQPMTEIIR